MQAAAVLPDSRQKPVVATVRGTGGGKTRALEEIRWGLLGDPCVLPLAITFNSTMDLDLSELRATNARCATRSVW